MDSMTPYAMLLVGQPTLARQLRMGIFTALDERCVHTATYPGHPRYGYDRQLRDCRSE
jgi:type II secretory pathway predicted ATPase ExeA